MAIWLFALEAAFASLAGFAFWFSLLGLIKSRAIYVAVGLILWLIVAGPLGALATASFEVRAHGSEFSYFPQAATLAVIVIIGGLWLLIRKAPRREGGRRTSRWSLVRLLCLWIVLGAVGWFIRYRLNATAQAFAAQTRSQVARDYADLTGPMPADTDNAAHLYELAFAQIDAVEREFDRQREEKANARAVADAVSPAAALTQPATAITTAPEAWLTPNEPIKACDFLCTDQADRPETIDLLTRFAPAMKIVTQAANRTACRFKAADEVPDVMKWEQSHPSYLNQFREAANTVATHAIEMSHQGKVNVAIRDIQTINQLSRHIDQTEPCLVAGMVRVGVQALAYDTLIKVLPYSTDPASLIHDISYDESSIRAAFHRAMRGESAQVLGTMLRFSEGNIESRDEVVQSPGAGMFYGIFWLRSDVNAAQDYFKDLLDRPLEPFDPSTHDNHSGSLLFQIMIPALGHSKATYLHLIANSRQAQIAIALTRYRLKAHIYPAALDVLVPRLLPAMPADPFDGKPMRYRLDGGDAVIYSVGENQIDDGGQIDVPPKDWGVRLRLTPQRNP